LVRLIRVRIQIIRLTPPGVIKGFSIISSNIHQPLNELTGSFVDPSVVTTVLGLIDQRSVMEFNCVVGLKGHPAINHRPQRGIDKARSGLRSSREVTKGTARERINESPKDVAPKIVTEGVLSIASKDAIERGILIHSVRGGPPIRPGFDNCHASPSREPASYLNERLAKLPIKGGDTRELESFFTPSFAQSRPGIALTLKDLVVGLALETLTEGSLSEVPFNSENGIPQTRKILIRNVPTRGIKQVCAQSVTNPPQWAYVIACNPFKRIGNTSKSNEVRMHLLST